MDTFNFKVSILVIIFHATWINGYSAGDNDPKIFPLPLEIKSAEGTFSIDGSTFILMPEKESSTDNFLSGLLFSEILDKYEKDVILIKRSSFPVKDKFILIGDLSNPLVKIL